MHTGPGRRDPGEGLVQVGYVEPEHGAGLWGRGAARLPLADEARSDEVRGVLLDVQPKTAA
jgi:hypothetical protein